MSEKRMRELRKKIYGDYSPRLRRYMMNTKTGQILCTGLRAKYQQANEEERGDEK